MSLTKNAKSRVKCGFYIYQRRERDLYRLRNIFRINILSNSAKRTLEMHGCKESMLIMKNNLRRILKER
jgi:hypothetical protein